MRGSVAWGFGAIVVMCLLATGLVLGTVPDESGVIHGCYDKKTGFLRVIDSASAACTSKETALPWSQVGPQGAPGATGEQGDPGNTGATGATGATGEQGAGGDARVLTINGSVTGSDAPTACPVDYHMASIWEIREPSAVRYQPTAYGFPNTDLGDGPPGGFAAWVRTGTARSGLTGFPQPPNCRMWTSSASDDYGALAELIDVWNPLGVSGNTGYALPVSAWFIKEATCDQTHAVWCVKD
jgi:hypothetical protein